MAFVHAHPATMPFADKIFNFALDDVLLYIEWYTYLILFYYFEGMNFFITAL